MSVKNSLAGVRCVSHTGEELVGWREAIQERAQNRSMILESEP